MDINVTRIQFNGENLYFWANTAKFQIPSKIYPLSSKKHKKLFYDEVTNECQNEELISIIDSVTFEMGFCYSNAYEIYWRAKEKGIDLEYYSGWFFINNNMPLHHAWLIYHDGDSESIIDTANIKIITMVHENLKNNSDIKTLDEYRKRAVILTKKLEKKHPYNHEQITIGKALPQMKYFGSPDTMENAKRIYRDAISNFPQHPSYQGEGQNVYGRSKLQEEYLQASNNHLKY